MKQLLILSGKGGTGKTTVASAFIKLADALAYADCDVDAPNLHLVMGRIGKPKRSAYFSLPKAEIDLHKCIACGQCMQHCRFHAIHGGPNYAVDPFACEGCGVCEAICPVMAVSMRPAQAGELMLYADRFKAFSTAELKMGSGTSGKLVAEVKKQLLSAAPQHTDLALYDGSPGIGCPVIASLSGADLVLIVTEPSVSGISDMERIIKTAQIFRTKIAVCINKYDTNQANAVRIEELCNTRELPFTGKIPFDPMAIKAINEGLTIVDVDCPAGTAIRNIFRNTMKLLD
jgi:MinD superfamily P-loop ATPase